MSIFDGSHDPTSPDGGTSLGWLGLVLGAPLNASQPQGWPDQGSANAAPRSVSASRSPTSAGGVAPGPAMGNPFSGARDAVGSLFSPPPANAPSALPSPGLGDRLSAALMNFATSRGLLPALAGGITGLSTGQRTDPAGIVQQRALSTYQTLVGAGVSPVVARAAAINPDIMRAIVPGLVGTMPRPGGPPAGLSSTGRANVPPPWPAANSSPTQSGRVPGSPTLGAPRPSLPAQPSVDFWKA